MDKASIFSSENFMPHGHCYLWRPDILWLSVLSDSTIFISYMLISGSLMFYLQRTPALPYRWVIFMFSTFIFLCGVSHLMDIITVWRPIYYMAGLIKCLTAAISIVTGILFLPIAPKAFNFIAEKVDHEKTDSKESQD